MSRNVCDAYGGRTVKHGDGSDKESQARRQISQNRLMCCHTTSSIPRVAQETLLGTSAPALALD